MTRLRTLKVTANEGEKTFSIKVYFDGNFFTEYITVKMNQEEFEEAENNTENDWKQFLKTGSYYIS
tara:strand:+ start:199 stop:396 length:198 start_codon:yes stop_codon:yes gene_type:complete